MSFQQTKSVLPRPGRHIWFGPSTQGLQAADSRLFPRIFDAADIEPTIREPKACQKSASQHCAWRHMPHTGILGCFGFGALRPHVVATPPQRAPRVTSGISCCGTHLHSWSSHSYCRNLMRPHRATFWPNLRRARMNLRESSVRTRQLGQNR
jgi:hypothetical protein